MIKRPVFLFSMDSEQFHAAPLTTGGLQAYYQRYGQRSDDTEFHLLHFRDAEHIDGWQKDGIPALVQICQSALAANQQPILGFSFYTWNAAEFLQLIVELKRELPEFLCVAGGPHVQEAKTYLLSDPIDLIVLGEGEQTFTELLDRPEAEHWPNTAGLAWAQAGQVVCSAERPRETELDRLPSALDVVALTNDAGQPLYDSIAYETSRGCPFKCAFCEWGTGAIGTKMHQFSMGRIRDDWQKVVAAGIENIWLADSNFGALREDLEKTQLICDLKNETGLPRTFATSWSKKHSSKVQQIVLLLNQNGLLPHYQLALQTLTPLALELSNRKNMAANKYEPIAREMADAGVPIAAELIWGLPGDNLADFERNLDQLLATFPNINIFGYTLLPGTEFYQRRDEYQIEAVPVAGYGKAKGEYVVACHTFARDEGLDGYFLIAAHMILIHGHMMPLTIRFLAMQQDLPATPLLRVLLKRLLMDFSLQCDDRLGVYEGRAAIYLSLIEQRERSFDIIGAALIDWCTHHQADTDLVDRATKVLALDAAICPRSGKKSSESIEFGFDAASLMSSLEKLNLPDHDCFTEQSQTLIFEHPGGVGEVLKDPDGGSWMRAHWYRKQGFALSSNIIPLQPLAEHPTARP
ncbi:MAG: cobalamin-dependent protein [Pseudomonadota bacterium]